MKTNTIIFCISVLLAIPASSAQSEKPPIPYSDFGACPFEGCTYRDWETTALVQVYAEPKVGARKIFIVPKGSKVKGITGVVITFKAGITKVTKRLELGDDSKITLMPGDILYTLHYAGEGFDTFWFKGKVYTDQISSDVTEKPDPEMSVHVLSKPVDEWWVKIKTRDGKVGWTNESRSFAHMDAFE